MKKVLLLTIVLLAVTGLVAAQEDSQAPPPPPGQRPAAQGPSPSSGPGDAQYSADAPGGGPGVAHLSFIHGDVSMQRGDSGDWLNTSLNTPIVSGDVLATSGGSRAEVQLDFADILRLSGQSQAKIADLSQNHIQVQIAQGQASMSLIKGGQAEVEIDTPNAAIHPKANGNYRIEVVSDTETNVIVRAGEAEISTPQGSTTVKEGEIISIRGTDDPEYKIDDAQGSDDWDRWNSQRDDLIANSQGSHHTNRYYSGSQDLDGYGHWENVPNYGEVWSPSGVGPDWAPYQAGRWVWEPYYGWTWVSYEPWGWAPYHYGRWFFWNASWYWWPGPITPFYRPIWSPAFVSFIGFGPHIGFGFGFGTIGWFPLGPFEVFHPWWGFGFNRFGVFSPRPFGFGFRGTFGVAFTNARVRAGITTVAAENFGRGPAAFGHGVDVGTLRGAHFANGNLGIVPTHESLASTNRGFRAAPTGMRNVASTHFFSRTQPSHSVTSFHEQTSKMQEAVRSHGSEGQFNSREQTGMGRNSGGTAAGERSGSNTFSRGTGNTGNPANSRMSGGNQMPNNGARDGYQTFSRGSQNGGSQPAMRNDRPPSTMGGASRPQYDIGKNIAVPRNNSVNRSGNYSGGNNGSRNTVPNYGSRGGSGAYSGGNRSYSGGARGGSSSSRSSSGGSRGGGGSHGGHR